MNDHERLIEHISDRYRTAQIEVHRSSGATTVDVRHGDRFIVVQMSPALGIGVSEVLDEADGFTGHDRVFGSVEEAILRVDELLSKPPT